MTQAERQINYVVTPPPTPQVKVVSEQQQDAVFPIHRIYCVARNYADHAREMGEDPVRETPCFFSKPADTAVDCHMDDGETTCTEQSSDVMEIPYPLLTSNLHYEIELVIAIGKAGVQIPVDSALEHVYGYAIGCDLTRRDLQAVAKSKGRPWDSAKGFDRAAPMGHIFPAVTPEEKDKFTALLDPKASTEIWLDVNGERRQFGTIQQMIWNVPEVISCLSQEFELQAGDLIMTGTPAGVGAIKKGDLVTGGIHGIGKIAFRIS